MIFLYILLPLFSHVLLFQVISLSRSISFQRPSLAKKRTEKEKQERDVLRQTLIFSYERL